MKLFKQQALFSAYIDNATEINCQLLAGFYKYMDDDTLKRSHFFAGRYENIYINQKDMPEINSILQAAVKLAGEILNISADKLKAGGWFNAMEPGQKTLPHSHDDDDELLSAVYYIHTPPGCGQLVLRDGNFTTYVEPKEGMFVFFPANLTHEVEQNLSQKLRLSMGINIGPN